MKDCVDLDLKNAWLREVQTQETITESVSSVVWYDFSRLPIYRFEAYVRQSEQDVQFSSICGRICYIVHDPGTHS